MTANLRLQSVLQKYQARSLQSHAQEIDQLKYIIYMWAEHVPLDIFESGSRAKGTAISIASDLDLFVAVKEKHLLLGTLRDTYETLYQALKIHYPSARKQNVSIRVTIGGLQIDVTPGRVQEGWPNYHSIYVSKRDTWQQTSVRKHIVDISTCGRLDEIKLLKIWRHLHGLEFPSVYLEYLIIGKLLVGQPVGSAYLADNVLHIMRELSREDNNPLFARIVDPASSGNILSDLLTYSEKERIISTALKSRGLSWSEVFY